VTGIFDAQANTWKPSADSAWIYTNIHAENDLCRTEGCMIHNPDTEWIGNRDNWPYYPRSDGRMERLCPHGVGHGDINSVHFLDRVAPRMAAGVHGCDGCCNGARHA
jgi:hypothetical protein